MGKLIKNIKYRFNVSPIRKCLFSGFRESGKDLFCKFYQASLDTRTTWSSSYVITWKILGLHLSPALSSLSVWQKTLKNNFNKVQINYQWRSISFTDHLFSMYAKFSEKLTFLHVRVRIRGKESLGFRKFLRRY